MKNDTGPDRPRSPDSLAVLRRALSALRGPASPSSGRRRPSFRRGLSFLALGATVAVGVGAYQAEQGVEVVSVDEVVGVAPAPVELPVEMNARVAHWMKRFRTDQRATFEVFLTRQGLYEDLIRSELRERGMPEDLIYLAMIESGFSPRATSSAAAAGVWQFMGPTAREYGLTVDRWVDERRDPVRATGAALDYLEWLHGRYDSWYLAAAAYNAGPGRVDRILKRHAEGRKGDEAIYWEIIDHLPRETRDYVPKLLAASMLARDAESFGFEVRPAAAYAYDRVWVPGSTRLAEVASSLGVGMTLMKELNPHLVRQQTPPGASFALRVPVGTSHQLIASMGGGGRILVRADD